MSTKLTSYIKGLAWKRAVAVEVDGDVSNQHEFNGVNRLIALLGDQKLEKRKCIFIRLEDDPEESASCEGTMTWYDARESHPTRTEWRLYYTPNDVIRSTDVGDTVFLARRHDRRRSAVPGDDFRITRRIRSGDRRPTRHPPGARSAWLSHFAENRDFIHPSFFLKRRNITGVHRAAMEVVNDQGNRARRMPLAG